MPQLTQKRLKEILHYNQYTGVFTWKVFRGGKAKVGSIAGCMNKETGYMQIQVDGKQYLFHRLVWFYVHGYFPEYEIDHKNGIRNDNSLLNLREVAHTCNLQNASMRSNNTSGFQGVCWNKNRKKWVARIQINNKNQNLGYYDTSLDAALARYTVEVQCPNWTCDHRSELAKAIEKAWPGFKDNGHIAKKTK